MAPMSISFSQSVICWSMLSKGDYLLLSLTEQSRKQWNQCDADKRNTAACHELFHTLALGSRVIIAVTLKAG